MTDFDTLNILLYDRPIAKVTNLPGDRNLFSFNEDYINDHDRPTLSLSFKDSLGDLISDIRPTRTRLPPFLANLLPEGHMRNYLASQANVNSEREFFLLAALGQDLPGALKAIPAIAPMSLSKIDKEEDEFTLDDIDHEPLRFSLAGVQLKLSAIWENEGGLTIPVDGVGGSWIVKLPSAIYPGVPENEFVMMELARQIGIDVPETALVSIDQISGLPANLGAIANHAYIIKRFDRSSNGAAVHIEDFAQVFGVYPENKYKKASYKNIADVLWSETGERGIEEFIRRFVFNVLIGNGDMHLKNWSLIYSNKRQASIAPAYDYVSTIPYLPDDRLALTFVDSKSFQSITFEQLKRFAAKSQLPESLVLDTARDTIDRFMKLWGAIGDFQLDPKVIKIIDNHLKTLPII